MPKINFAGATTEARLFANEAIKILRKYPAKSSRSRYRRTFNLRRGWKKEISPFGSDLDIDIFNDKDYAGFLQGRRFTGDIRQTKRAQRQGWVSLTDIDRKVWPRHQIRIGRALGIKVRIVPHDG